MRLGLKRSCPVAVSALILIAAGSTCAKTQLRVAHWWTDNAFKAVIDQYQKLNPDVEIKQEIRPWGDYLTKMLVETASGKTADVYMVSGVWFPDTIFRNAILKPLARYAKADRLDLNKFAVDPYIEHGKGNDFYALAQWVPGSSVLWVNKALTKAAGVAVPEYGSPSFDTWRWDDLLEAAKKTTKFDATGKALNFGLWPQLDSIFGLAWTMQNGAEMFDDPLCRKTNGIHLTTKEYMGAIQWLYDLKYKYRVSPQPNQTGGFSGLTPFHSGKLAFFQGWSLYQQISQVKFDWTVIPVPYSTRKVTQYGGNSWGIAANTKKATQAWKFVKFMTTDPRAQKLLVDNVGLCAYDLDRQLKNLDSTKDPKKYMMSAINVSRTKNVTFRPQWFGSRNSAKVIEILDGYLNQIWSSKLSVSNGLSEAEKKINKVVYNR